MVIQAEEQRRMLDVEDLLRGLEQAEADTEVQALPASFCVYQNGLQSLAIQESQPENSAANRLLRVLNTTLLEEAVRAPNFEYPAFADGLNVQELQNPSGVFHPSSNPATEALNIPRRIEPSMISINMSPARQTLQLVPQSLAAAVLQPPTEWSIEEVAAVGLQEVVQKSVLSSREKLKSYSRAEWNTANKLTPGGMDVQDLAPVNEYLSSEYNEQSLSIFTDEPRLFEQLPRFISARAADRDDVKFFNPEALLIKPQPRRTKEIQPPVGGDRAEKHQQQTVEEAVSGGDILAAQSHEPAAVPSVMPDFNTAWDIGKFEDLLDDDDDLLLLGTQPAGTAAGAATDPATTTPTEALPQSVAASLPRSEFTSSVGESETKGGDLEDFDAVLELAVSRAENVVGKATRQASELEHSRSSESKQTWAQTTLLDNREFDALRPRLVLQYPFELDDFQKQAIMRLERRECIFVAAHTSAGKTVVAEYAIAMARSHMTRAIYTSPIKALSNQKYRDFKDRFEDVGIITGDVSVNPEASCLIMTTEILRSMLYRGADLIKDIEWVIFDEVHYVNDTERGVVWEEVIIMLPDHVNMIFLSATTPNTVEFSDWIGRIKRKPVYVISTPKRPVPLQHFLYSDDELFKIMDHRGTFSTAIYDNAVRKRKDKDAKPDKTSAKQAGGRGAQQGRGGQQGRGAPRAKAQPQSAGARQTRELAGSKSQWNSLIKLLKKSNLLPVVVFSFSRKKCEECADALQSADLLDNREKSAVHRLMNDVKARLTDGDARLSQVLRIRDLLLKGIGVHHGGLLPILKEMVEILFAKGVVKVLFATETFAMGVNMPARTVVFNGIRKHDGKDFRDLLPGEYTQMAGRAGRRGLDRVGTVILTCWSDIPPATSLRVMLTGAATKLQSQFRLTYNMILNLLRAEDMSVEDMIKRSFSEFHTQRALGNKNIPEQLARLTAKLEQLQTEAAAEDCFDGEVTMQDFHQLVVACQRSSALHLDYVMRNSKQASSIMSAGRVVLFARDDMPPSPAVILQSADETAPAARAAPIELKADDVDSRGNLRNPTSALSSSATRDWKFSVLVLCPADYFPPAPSEEKEEETQRKGDAVFDNKFGRLEAFSSSKLAARRSNTLAINASGVADGRTWYFTHAKPEDIVLVSTRKKKVSVDEVLEGDARSIAATIHMLEEFEGAADLPGVDAVRDFKLNELDFVNSFLNAQGLQMQLLSNPFYRSPKLVQQYALAEKISRVQHAIAYLRHALSGQSLTLFPDFQQRLSILQRLGYADPATNTVGLKGRVACEINTCEELIATELIFENVLEPLNPPEAVAMLSALVFQEKGHDAEPLTTRMEEAKQRMIDITMGLGQLQFQAGLPTNAQDYCKHLNFGLAHVVYLWATKAPFSNISELTTAPAGSIVRCITRLDELCRDVRNAARVIGNPSLYRKMEDASLAIRRDIVFAASLYIK